MIMVPKSPIFYIAPTTAYLEAYIFVIFVVHSIIYLGIIPTRGDADYQTAGQR